jgi:putative inorganic carbon (HCO3(-)) transporter
MQPNEQTNESIRPDTVSVPGERSGRSPNLITGKHVGFIALIAAAIGLGLLALFMDTTVLLAVVLAVMAGIATLAYPMLGLIAFIVLNFIRPSDWVAGLGALPLAKLVGGGTLLAICVRYLPNRDFRYNYRQTWLLLAFALALFVSVPFSFWPGKSLNVSLDFLKLILFYLIFVNIVRSVKSLRIVSIITMLSVAVLAFSSVKAYMAGSFRAGADIGAGMFGDANDVAQVYVTVLPLAFFWNLRTAFRDLRFWGYAIAMGFATILTQSRGGMLGLAAVVFCVMLRGRNKLVGTLIFAVLALAVAGLLPSQFSDRYKSIGTYEEDASAMGRIDAWKAGTQMMLTRPLTGVGIGCFDIAFGQKYRPAGFFSNKWMAPHNTLVQIGGETGLIGLSLWLWMFGYCVVQLRRLKPAGTDKEKEEIDLARDSLLIGFLGFGVTAFFLTQGLNYLLYFLIAATVCVVKINKDAAEREARQSEPETVPVAVPEEK